MARSRQLLTAVAYAGFDPVTDEAVFIDHLTNRYGAGWRMEGFDAETRTVSASRPAAPPIIEKPAAPETVEPALEAVAG